MLPLLCMAVICYFGFVALSGTAQSHDGREGLHSVSWLALNLMLVLKPMLALYLMPALRESHLCH